VRVAAFYGALRDHRIAAPQRNTPSTRYVKKGSHDSDGNWSTVAMVKQSSSELFSGYGSFLFAEGARCALAPECVFVHDRKGAPKYALSLHRKGTPKD
jgi:hypothetical protein